MLFIHLLVLLPLGWVAGMRITWFSTMYNCQAASGLHCQAYNAENEVEVLYNNSVSLAEMDNTAIEITYSEEGEIQYSYVALWECQCFRSNGYCKYNTGCPFDEDELGCGTCSSPVNLTAKFGEIYTKHCHTQCPEANDYVTVAELLVYELLLAKIASMVFRWCCCMPWCAHSV